MTKEQKRVIQSIAVQLLDGDLKDNYTPQSLMLVVGADTVQSQQQVNQLLRPFNSFYNHKIKTLNARK